MFIAIIAVLAACARHTPEAGEPATLAREDTLTPLERPIAQEWRMGPGLLRPQVETWAATAGYQVVWDVTRDYHMQSASVFRGTFVEALRQLFMGMQRVGNSFKVVVYQGNAVVVVTEE